MIGKSRRAHPVPVGLTDNGRRRCLCRSARERISRSGQRASTSPKLGASGCDPAGMSMKGDRRVSHDLSNNRRSRSRRSRSSTVGGALIAIRPARRGTVPATGGDPAARWGRRLGPSQFPSTRRPGVKPLPPRPAGLGRVCASSCRRRTCSASASVRVGVDGCRGCLFRPMPCHPSPARNFVAGRSPACSYTTM